MINKLLTYIKHIPGWSTNKKIIVIESDDWGSTRMPNKEIRDTLIDKGYKITSNFLKYDTIASENDLQALFEVLDSVKGANGKPAVLSPFVNVTNPDFKKIIEDDFQNYHYETFDKTQEKYYSKNLLSLWKEGMKHNLYSPQYHGREHFNVPLLMDLLRSKDKYFMNAFKMGVVHLPLQNIQPKELKSIAPAYYFENSIQLESHINSLKEGIILFEKILGIKPNSFAAPNGIFHPKLEMALKDTEIKNLVVNRNRIEPNLKGGLTSRSFNFSFGQKNTFGHVYYLRNVKFEPVQESYNFNKVLFEIKAAFTMKKPAVISTHRVNYIGEIEVNNKDKNLKELSKLLKTIIKHHPDAIFISSTELGNMIREDN